MYPKPHVALVLFCFQGHLNIATKSEIPVDWKSYIAPDMLEKYLGKDSDDKFTDGLFEGDILGLQSDAQANSADIAKNAITDIKFRWPGGMMPIIISGMFRQEESKFIKRAMKSMTALTYGYVTFMDRTDETDYVEIIRGFGCFSLVGRQGGKQIISLSRGCLEALGDVQHELMHALGFYHELSRSDRDNYIWINWPNIQKENVHQFQIYPNGSTFGLSYDYESVLHYPFTAFAIDINLPTIVPKQKGARIGQNTNLSPGDITKIQIAYKPAVRAFGFPEEYRPKLSTELVASSTEATWPINLILPSFRMEAVSASECKSLDTESCFLSTNSNNCIGQYFVIVFLSSASNSEITFVMTSIDQLHRDRPIDIEIRGQRPFTQDLLAPVKRNVLWLTIALYDNLSTRMLKQVDLPNVIQLYICDSSDVEISSGDFDCFPQMRQLVLERTSIKRIEKGSFDGLQGLKMLALEYRGQSNALAMKMEQLWRLHCGCDYAWLRDLFRKRPYLLKARAPAEVFNIAGRYNPTYARKDFFVPVDCASRGLIESANQESFSVNDDNC